MKYAVVVPWHNPEQLRSFLDAWGMKNPKDDHSMLLPQWLFLEQDKDMEGCAVTKNKGIQRALDEGAEVIVVLDDDCYPQRDWLSEPTISGLKSLTYRNPTLQELAEAHIKALEPQPVELYEAITDPPSRGTPCFNRCVTMPVAASMGFWTGVPDLDAATSLRRDSEAPIEFKRKTMFGRFFPFSGMNCAFRAEFWPFFKFEEGVGRMDDIFMGYRLQAEAYKRGYCISLNGPLVRHSRQSNVWANLKVEAEFMERNENEWIQYTEWYKHSR